MDATRQIWILGSTGFIGRALVRQLASDKRNRLHLLIHKTTDYSLCEDFNCITGSLAGIDKAWFERYPPDVIFHLARPAGSNVISRSYAGIMGEWANQRLLNILAQLPDKPVIVYVSGSLMYGNRHGLSPAFEDSPLAPISFARYYHRLERPLLRFSKKGDADIRIARPGWITGPDSWFYRYFWMPYIQEGHVPCYGDGKQLMSLIDLDDCTRMIAALGLHGQFCQPLNIFSGTPMSQLAFSEFLSTLLQCSVRHVPYIQTRSKYGKTVADALVSSIHMGTHYREIHHKANVHFSDAETMLSRLIGLLKNEQRIFTKAPQKGFVQPRVYSP